MSSCKVRKRRFQTPARYEEAMMAQAGELTCVTRLYRSQAQITSGTYQRSRQLMAWPWWCVALLQQQTLAADLDQSIRAVVAEPRRAGPAAARRPGPARGRTRPWCSFWQGVGRQLRCACTTCHRIGCRSASDELRLSIKHRQYPAAAGTGRRFS